MADAANRGSYLRDQPQLFQQGLYEESSTQKEALGTRRRLNDGREFIYVKNGAANTVAGQVYQTSVGDVANIANLAITANGAIGDKSIAFTLGNSNLANVANAFAEGYAYINTGAGKGHAYKIKGHAAIAANANGTLLLSDQLRADIAAATSKVSLYKHPCRDVVVHPSPPTGALVGVAPMIITANYHGWLQTKGPCAVEVDGTVVNGDVAIGSANADGTISPAANGLETEQRVGHVMANNANDHWALVDLQL